jgi:hypothetical protein
VWTFYEGNDLGDVDRYDAMMTRLRSGDLDVAPAAHERSFVMSALDGLFRILKGCTPVPADWFASGIFRTADGHDVRMYFALYGRLPADAWSAEHAAALAETREVLRRAHALAARQRATLVVVFIPLAFRVYKDFVQCVDSRCTDSALDDLPQRLASAAREVSPAIRYVDLTPALTAEAKRGRLMYFPDDLHWTTEGHRVAGEAIAAAIAPLLDTRRR